MYLRGAFRIGIYGFVLQHNRSLTLIRHIWTLSSFYFCKSLTDWKQLESVNIRKLIRVHMQYTFSFLHIYILIHCCVKRKPYNTLNLCIKHVVMLSEALRNKTFIISRIFKCININISLMVQVLQLWHCSIMLLK